MVANDVNRYQIEYGDIVEGSRVIVGTWQTSAPSYIEALDKFYNSSDDDGFHAFRIRRLDSEGLHHRSPWRVLD